MAVLLTVILALGFAAAGETKTKARGCPKGVRVTVAHRTGCLSIAALRPSTRVHGSPRARSSAAITDHLALSVARLRKGLRLNARQAATAEHRLAALAVRLVAATGSVASAGPVLSGVTKTPAADDQVGPGSSGATVTGEVEVVKGAPPFTARETSSETLQGDRCPDADGILKGTWRNHLVQTLTGPPAGTARLRQVFDNEDTVTATITGHMADSGHVATFDVHVTDTLRSQIKVLGPGGLEHAGTDQPQVTSGHFDLVGIPLGGSVDLNSSERLKNLAIDHDTGSNVAFVRDGQVVIAKDLLGPVIGSDINVSSYQAKELLSQADAFIQTGGCLKAAFSPARLQLDATGQDTIPISVSIADTKGHPVSMPLNATPYGGTVAPSSATTAADGSASFTLTVPTSSHGGGLHVHGTSKRGVVDGIVSGLRPDVTVPAYAFSAHIAGTASYHEDDANSSTQWHYDTTNFSFSGDWPQNDPIILRADGGTPTNNTIGAVTAGLTGTENSSGAHTDPGGNSSFTCSGPLAFDGNPADVSVTQTGSNSLSLVPFTGLAADPNSAYCQTSGTWFGSSHQNSIGLAGVNDIQPALKVTVAVTHAQLNQTSFSVPLTVSNALPLACANGGSPTCTHTLSYTGTITFTRLYPCMQSGGNLSCGIYNPARDTAGAKD